MTKDQLIEKINKVENARTQRNIIYEVLDELGISYKRTNCSRCLNDLLLIAKEELGLVESAAEESSFNSDGKVCYTYTCDRPQTWNGYVIDNSTPVEIIRKFLEKFPVGYYAVEDCTEDTPAEKIEEIVGEEFDGHKVVPHEEII